MAWLLVVLIDGRFCSGCSFSLFAFTSLDRQLDGCFAFTGNKNRALGINGASGIQNGITVLQVFDCYFYSPSLCYGYGFGSSDDGMMAGRFDFDVHINLTEFDLRWVA